MEKDPSVRAEVIEQVLERQITQRQGAYELGISIRQMQRLCRRYQSQGLSGLQHGLLGRSSGRKAPAETRDLAIQLIKQHYHDYGPTLAHEKLAQDHGLKISRSTVRKWMIESGIWNPKRTRKRVYQRRSPRERAGELLQLDGSHHPWFEDRGPKCCLTIAIDDATKEIVGATFSKGETSEAYMEVMEGVIKKKGRPKEIYTDKGSSLKVNNSKDPLAITQFGRAIRELGIIHTYAHSPQAKGRVERAFRTLQDRLVKELRAKEISSVEDANKFIRTYIKNYNRQFSCTAENPNDAYRTLRKDHNLDYILGKREERKVTKDLSFSYGGEFYAIDSKKVRVRSKQMVEVVSNRKGLQVYVEGKLVKHRKCAFNGSPAPVIKGVVKDLNNNRYRPEAHKHPWKRNYRDQRGGR